MTDQDAGPTTVLDRIVAAITLVLYLMLLGADWLLFRLVIPNAAALIPGAEGRLLQILVLGLAIVVVPVAAMGAVLAASGVFDGASRIFKRKRGA